MTLPLVSVIIPSYNAGQWIQEAINSCLNQGYPHLEIIVVDDYSTDNTLEILRYYGDSIHTECLPVRSGANVARNRGLALAKGEFIQFLDADDYIQPAKIENQTRWLIETGDDIVYGDWKFLLHSTPECATVSNLKIAGKKADILAALLSNWWTATASLLYRRSVIGPHLVWDETIKVGQDRDFLLSLVISGARVSYQPGFVSVYRRYGNSTVSTASTESWVRGHTEVVDKALRQLAALNRLTPAYRYAIASSYYGMARTAFHWDRAWYDQLLTKALTLEPAFIPKDKNRLIRQLRWLVGFSVSEQIVLASVGAITYLRKSGR